MTRKRISDLLREEAGNNILNPQSTTIEAEVKPVPLGQLEPMPVSEALVAPHPLVAEVQTLKADLEKARQEAIAKAEALAQSQQQVTALKGELQKAKSYQKEVENQKELIGKLYGELQKENPLKAELEEQNVLIERLSAEIEQLKQAPPTRAAIAKSKLSATAAIARANPSAQKSALANLPVYRPIPRPIGKTLPGHDKQATIDNDVIGWFD